LLIFELILLVLDKAFASLSAFAKAVEKEILNISKKKPSDREIDEAV